MPHLGRWAGGTLPRPDPRQSVLERLAMPELLKGDESAVDDQYTASDAVPLTLMGTANTESLAHCYGYA